MSVELTVIGTGSLLMGDDGVGVRIIQALAPREQTGGGAIEYLDGSVGGLRLLNWIEQARRLLFVDAARFGSPARAGRHRLYRLDELLAGASGGGEAPAFSLHQTDLLSVLKLARQFYRVPPTWLLAIEVERVGPTDQLSEPLTEALPGLVEMTRQLAETLAKTPLN